jgi:predicted amidophosphoribosyltransferase
MPKHSYQYGEQIRHIKLGLCRTCSKKRNKSKEFCDEHLKKNSERARIRYQKNKKWRKKYLKYQSNYKKLKASFIKESKKG